MTEFMNMSFNTGKTWKKPNTPCDHGWDGKKFWITPKGKCVKCGEVPPDKAA